MSEAQQALDHAAGQQLLQPDAERHVDQRRKRHRDNGKQQINLRLFAGARISICTRDTEWSKGRSPGGCITSV